MIRKKGTNGCLKGLKCRSEIGTLSGAVGRGGGWKAVHAKRTAAESIVALKVGEKSHLGFSIEEWPFLLLFPKLSLLGFTLQVLMIWHPGT
jgi:hypothetical protein